MLKNEIINLVLKEAKVVKADYDTDVHPENRKFWDTLHKNPTNALGRHPVFTLHGKDLDKASYTHTNNLAKDRNYKKHELMRVFAQMQQIEMQHAEELQNLAKKAVAQLMQVDESELEAKLTNDVDQNTTEKMDPQEKLELPKRLLDHANKRVTSNALMQGGSIHTFLTAHFFDQIEKSIKKIDPRLMEIYSKFSVGTHHLYWTENFATQNLQGAAIGSEKVVQDEKGELKVKAKSVCFVALVHELVKGVLELRYIKHLTETSSTELSDEDIQKIYQYGDSLEDEIKSIQIGPELWRRFLAVVNASVVKKHLKLVKVYEELMKLSPKDLHDFILLVVNDKNKAVIMLEELMKAHTTVDIEKLLEEQNKFSSKKKANPDTITAPVKTPTTTPSKPDKTPRIIPMPKPKNETIVAEPTTKPTTTPAPSKTPTPRIIPMPKPKNKVFIANNKEVAWKVDKWILDDVDTVRTFNQLKKLKDKKPFNT